MISWMVQPRSRSQSEALGLEPWQFPPAHADLKALDETYGDASARRETAELAMRMRRLGISRWHPDPARECERIEAEQRRRAG
jgi:hypothetical protein